jgi:hypothetical protein
MDNSNHPPTRTKYLMAFLCPLAYANYLTASNKTTQSKPMKMYD